MERLTKRLSSGAPTYNYPASCYFDDDSGPDKIAQSAFRQRCVERLADYEDSACEPEEVLPKDKADEIVLKLMRLADLESLCSYTRLRELAEADKDGRLVVLPCKAGDTVYEVTSRKTISEYRVKAIRVELFCTFIEWDIVAGFVDKSIFGVPVDEIGKTVFLTREEAKAALEAMKNE
jgi:hypothetical protein|nr:MAG TPA: hypothetical protein [Caudoviricetes sp.]